MRCDHNNHGFTFIEIISVLVILAIVGAVIIGKGVSPTPGLVANTNTLKAHLRYAQSMAMGKNSPDDIFGIRCDASDYWLFQGNDPDAGIIMLPDDNTFNTGGDNKLDLAAKGISIAAFTVFFDQKGIPYAAYTDTTSNTPLSADLTLTVTPAGAGSPTESVTITQHTGFVP